MFQLIQYMAAKGRVIMAAAGHPELATGRAVQAAARHPNMAEGHATIAAAGYPNVVQEFSYSRRRGIS